MLVAVVDECPAAAARALNDAHVRKLILESAQILDSGSLHKARALDVGHAPVVRVPRSQINNPICRLARHDDEWTWIAEHLNALLREYEARYWRRHAYAERDVPARLRDARPAGEYRSDRAEPLFRLTDGAGRDLPLSEVVEPMRSLYAETKLRFPARCGGARPATWTRRHPPDWLARLASERGFSLVTRGGGGHTYQFEEVA